MTRLKAGFLNMMADKAFVVSERHFATLLGADHGREVNLERMTFGEIPRGPAVAAHIDRHYRTPIEVDPRDLDVLVISGAHVSDPVLRRQVFWEPLCRLFDWAAEADLPVLCSCLATHAVLEARHGERRRSVAPKVWGVFPHPVVMADHPLMQGLPTEVPVPHSRHNDVAAEQFSRAGYEVLLASEQVGVHLAVEKARGRWLLLQGHPEYEAVSLLKEYKREVLRWQAGERTDYPPLPQGYLGEEGRRIAKRFAEECLATRSGEAFPEDRLLPQIECRWTDLAVKVVGNWLEGIG